MPTSNDHILIRDADGAVTTVKLDKSFDINSRGSLTISGGQTLNVGPGLTLRIADQSPGGSIRNNGTLNITDATIQNQNTGLITNVGTINLTNSKLLNDGTALINQSAGTINNIGGLITNGAGAAFNNAGTVVNDTASNFVQRNAATFTNSGTLNQGGVVSFSTKPGSTITNSGRINMFENFFSNGGSIDNSGTLDVFHFGSYQSLAGELNNRTSGIIIISGTASNLANSTINNWGEIINHQTLINAGTITNFCGGTLIGPVNGNQPVDACSIV
jgi:hypothetical protein